MFVVDTHLCVTLSKPIQNGIKFSLSLLCYASMLAHCMMYVCVCNRDRATIIIARYTYVCRTWNLLIIFENCNGLTVAYLLILDGAPN